MAYLHWLADVLRGGGCRVWEDPHWHDRGHGGMDDIRGVLCHHTAGGGSNDWRVVRDGRPGLSGPLAQLCLERDGTYRVLAAGRSWHAGTGYVAWCGRNNGNNHLIGIEGVSTGRWGDWTPAQMDAYARGVAALLRHLRLPAGRALAHKEWAPNRKIDPSFDMGAFRATVSHHLAPPEEDIMASIDDLRRALREEVLWADQPREGATQEEGRETNLGTIVRWWDHAQVLDRQATEESEARIMARLDELEAKLEGGAAG